MQSILVLFRDRMAELAKLASSDEPQEAKKLELLTRLHRLLVAEYLDAASVSKLTVKQVLKLRTKAWGHAAEARQELFTRLEQIAEEKADAGFEAACRAAFDAYLAGNADFRDEARKLKFRATCDASGMTLTAAHEGVVDALLHGLTGVPGAGLLALGIAGVAIIKDLGSDGFDLYKKWRELRQPSGFSVVRPYRRFPLQRRK